MSSPNERLLYAAKTDSGEMLEEVLALPEGEFDVNHQDGLGNTALHYASSSPSPTALELLLDHDGTDVDLQNRLDGATPLHLAVKLESPAARQGVIEMLLEAGADPRIKDKHGSDVASYLSPEDVPEDAAIQRSIAISIAEFTVGGVDGGDLASDGDDDGEAGSGSGSGSDEE